MVTLVYDSSTLYDSSTPYEGGVVTGYLFTPPLVKDRPPFLPDSSQMQKELWMHYENRYRGVNVWIMSDGSVVQDTATPENSNTDMSGVYPWNPNDPSGPYVRSIFIDANARPQVATEHDVSHDPYPLAFYAGASTYPVSTATATLLTDYTAFGIGYADCLVAG